MGVMPDSWIRLMCLSDKSAKAMIEPFVDNQVKEISRGEGLSTKIGTGKREPVEVVQLKEKVISYGLSSYGYDCRLADEFKVFTNVFNSMIDPKHFDPKSFVEMKVDKCIIPPNSFALGRTLEWFRIPRDILTICLGKSTYARCGIIVNVTPFEPEWEGYATLEISNTTQLPAVVYANEGICQVIFLKGDGPCDISYKDRKGKYQGQTEIVLPKV